jgi:hypothetical protein
MLSLLGLIWVLEARERRRYTCGPQAGVGDLHKLESPLETQ